MPRLHPSGMAYLFFIVCTIILGMGYLCALWVFAVLEIAHAVFITLSRGAGYG